MLTPTLRLAGLAAALALAPAGARAEHERCNNAPAGSRLLVPSPGAFDVPRDTLFWLGDNANYFGEMGLVELIGGVENRVPLEERGRLVDASGNIWVLGSPVVLRANTVHRLYYCYGEFDSWCLTVLTEFTTGADTSPPPPDRPVAVSDAISGSVKDDAFVEATLDQDGVVIVDDPDSEFDPLTLTGRVGLVAQTDDGRLDMVESCNSWPFAKSGGEVRFGVYTASGAFTGWSEPESFSVPYYGCSLRDPGPAGLLALPLLLLRRRRRAR